MDGTVSASPPAPPPLAPATRPAPPRPGRSGCGTPPRGRCPPPAAPGNRARTPGSGAARGTLPAGGGPAEPSPPPRERTAPPARAPSAPLRRPRSAPPRCPRSGSGSGSASPPAWPPAVFLARPPHPRNGLRRLRRVGGSRADRVGEGRWRGGAPRSSAAPKRAASPLGSFFGPVLPSERRAGVLWSRGSPSPDPGPRDTQRPALPRSQLMGVCSAPRASSLLRAGDTLR